MKLLFIHDHKFRKINNKFYSTGGLDDSALQRYTSLFDDVYILSRVIEENNIGNRYSEIKNKNVHIINSFTISKKEKEQLITDVDRIIVRLPSFNGLKSLPLIRKKLKKYLVELVACPWDSYWNYDWRGKILAPLLFLMNRYEVKVAPYVLYVTDEFLQRRYPTKGKKVACSDVTLYDFSEEILNNRKQKINNLKNVVTIGTLAAIDVKYKGQDRIIKALSKLNRNGVKFVYRLAGNGNKDYLLKIAKKYKVEDCVIFDGGIPHEKINEWFDLIDIYIQPSLQEGLPRALLEAMSNALPCICANTGGMPELINKKYIFENGINSVKKFIEILNKFSLENMKSESKNNFVKAKLYEKTLLDAKRNLFFESFVKE